MNFYKLTNMKLMSPENFSFYKRQTSYALAYVYFISSIFYIFGGDKFAGFVLLISLSFHTFILAKNILAWKNIGQKRFGRRRKEYWMDDSKSHPLKSQGLRLRSDQRIDIPKTEILTIKNLIYLMTGCIMRHNKQNTRLRDTLRRQRTPKTAFRSLDSLNYLKNKLYRISEPCTTILWKNGELYRIKLWRETKKYIIKNKSGLFIGGAIKEVCKRKESRLSEINWLTHRLNY
jgi:hypothetical protein